MASYDAPPSLVGELRALRSRVSQLERQSLGIVRAAGFLDPVIVVLSNGTATLPDGAGVLVSFSEVDVDTAGIFDPGEPTQITVPRAGVYMLSGSAMIDPSGSATGYRSLEVVASTNPTTQVGFTELPPESTGWLTAPTTIAALDAGDTVTLNAAQESGGTLSLSSGRLAIAWLGVST